MKRRVISGLRKVDWSDGRRQNEFVNSVISALGALGEELDYDYVCAVSGCAFRTSFSVPTSQKWNHGNYHVANAPIIVKHTFDVLGYCATRHPLCDYETDRSRIVESIDKGIPIITLEGVINCADACVISGYDEGGDVLLGYNPFMYIKDDHDEPHDVTGYFRKTNWHGGSLEIITIGEKRVKPTDAAIFRAVCANVRRLIAEENLALGQYNGLAAHKAFYNALLMYEWTDNFEPYMNVMCNYKQYLDRRCAAGFFRRYGREDLADIYDKITDMVEKMGRLIPQDFSAFGMFSDKQKLRPYCDLLQEISALEASALEMLA